MVPKFDKYQVCSNENCTNIRQFWPWQDKNGLGIDFLLQNCKNPGIHKKARHWKWKLFSSLSTSGKWRRFHRTRVWILTAVLMMMMMMEKKSNFSYFLCASWFESSPCLARTFLCRFQRPRGNWKRSCSQLIVHLITFITIRLPITCQDSRR